MSPQHLHWHQFLPEVWRGALHMYLYLVEWVWAITCLVVGLALIAWAVTDRED